MNKRKKTNKKRGSQSKRTSRNGGISNNRCFNDGILYNILSRLPAKDLQQLKLVCKYWNSLIRDPHFVNLHFSRSKSSPDRTTLLINPVIASLNEAKKPLLFKTDLFRGGKTIPFENFDLHRNHHRFGILKPVNGLICLFNSSAVLIYNPCTGLKTTWINVTPTSSLRENYGESGRTMTFLDRIGFGFDPTTKKHKVVRIVEIYLEDDIFGEDQADHRVCEVLTVGENTWKKIDEVPPPYNLNPTEALHVNGVLYWIQRVKIYERPTKIVAFDLTNEKFRVIETPRNYWKGGWQSVYLVEVDGCIALLECVSKEIILRIFNDAHGCVEDNNIEKKSNDNSGNWIDEKIQPLPFAWYGSEHLVFQAIAGTDLIILQSFDDRIQFTKLCYFDRRKKSSYSVKIITDSSFPFSGLGYEIASFVESVFPV